ncbi:uncharacterized protein LOC144607478 [Rhinoraja longicauda]
METGSGGGLEPARSPRDSSGLEPADSGPQQESDPAGREHSPESTKSVRISTSLITERNLLLCAGEYKLEDIKEALTNLITVRLDRENINVLGNFEDLENTCSLYLQQNQIKKIENLESFQHLRFLTLASNRIQKVENLKCLQTLGFLDLSNNQIERLDPGEFPESLIILNLSGNGCTKQEEYREQVIQALPALQQLDGIFVQRRKDPNEGGDNQDLDGSENEEDSDELYDPESKKMDPLLDISYSSGKVKDFFVELHETMVRRSQERRKEVEKYHKTRLNELHEIRDQLARIRCELMGASEISTHPKSEPNCVREGEGEQNEEHEA